MAQYTRKTEILQNRRQTSREISRLVSQFSTDLKNIFLPSGASLASLPIDSFFNYVKNLKYVRDTEPIEKIGRPLWIMERINKGAGADCKKKAVLIASYLHLKNIPFRFIGSSRRPDGNIHHIFPQAFINGQWINFDATYPRYSIGQSKKVTAWEVL